LTKLRENRKWPDDKELLKSLETKSIKELARELGKSEDSIYSHLKTCGLLKEFREIQSKKEGYAPRVKKNHRSVYVPVGKSSCPSKEVLEDLLWKYPSTTIAKMFSVSDVAISKWARKYGLSKPGVGYWAKQYSISGREKV
jgi:transposase-like protein